MKPANKKAPLSKGFGFADAMFGIKDIAMEYGQLQGEPKNVVPKNEQTNVQKTQLIKKQPVLANKGSKIQKKVEMVVQKKKQAFTISAGKQYEGFSSTMLIPVESTEDIFQLTLKGELSNWQYNVFCDGIEANMIVPDPVVSFNFDATDVRQGGLGNCYFVSTLASLSHLPKILRQRIPKFKTYTGKTKSFEVNLFESGKSIRMQVDNLFPKVFTKPVGNDISPMILEKAYAQAYGNFEVTNMGHSCDSLRDLTGGPTQYVDLKGKAQLIQDLKKIFTQKYPIVIASKVNVKMMFLSPKHSFNVLDYKVEENELLLKLRDPRGINCSQFPLHVPIKPQESLNGIFWVDYKTLVQNFEVITICKAKQGYKYFYKTFKSTQLSNNQACMTLKVKERANFVFTCHQKHKKFFDQKFSYQVGKILLGKIETKNGKIIPLSTVGSEFKAEQVCSVTAELDEGEYIIFSQVGTSNSKSKMANQAFTVSIYTSIKNTASLEFCCLKGHVSVRDFLSLYIQTHLEQFKESSQNQKLYRHFGPLYGYLCMSLDNRSNKSFIEQFEYETENITITDTKVSLGPGQRKLIMHPIGAANSCSHKISFKVRSLCK